MKTLLRLFLVIAILAGIGAAGYRPAFNYWVHRNRPVWRTAKVSHGKIVAVVNSTGTLKPKIQVTIGSVVSGPIQELYCEFNQEVKKGDLLAKIDPRIYEAAVARDQAVLANREADVLRVRSQLQQAINDEIRSVALRTRDKSLITESDLDKFKFARMSWDAQLKVAQTVVDEAKANLKNSRTNLIYTEIRSPVDGIVINRKIDPGQTVAAQFQTPELFIVAPDMRREMHVHASVDEADIGLIKQAQEKKYPVTFTVDAYPSTLFSGSILEIRLSSATTQNVVTYPVVVSAPNPELRLLPGMTANISFQVDHRDNVVKIPNVALRFFPSAKYVRPEDLPILEGHAEQELSESQGQQPEVSLSASERSQSHKARARRHIWVEDGDYLRAVEVTTGLSDSQFIQMVDGPLKTGDLVVTGIQATASSLK